MNIVIATPIIFDKTSPFNHLFKDIIQGFVDSGNKITRLVATESLKDHSYDLDIVSNAIIYIPFTRKKTKKSNIIVRYLNDSLTNIKMARKIRKLKEGDVLFEDVSFSSFWAVRAAKKKRMRVVAMLQDVWPDNAVQSGLIKEGSLIYKFFEVWQKYVYCHADKLICISDDMKDFIVSKGIPAEKIEVVYNWGYNDEPVQVDWADNLFVKKYHISPAKKYVVYAGNIGRMQNVEIVVEAAKQLTNRTDIHFLIVGDGVNRAEIEWLSQGMENVTMLPLQPSELATHIYSIASANLAPLVSGGLKTALPSKIGVCLSCGNPLIVCADRGTKLEQMFNQYNCGKVIDSKNVQELVDSILQFCDEGFKKNYRCFEENFCRSLNTAKYAHALQGEKI